jgi:uncharacterized protein YxeA
MNLRIILAFVVAAVLTTFLWGKWQYHRAWDEGRQNLVQQQKAKAEVRLQKQTLRQSKDDARAAAADEKGAAKTVTITQEVVKYIQTPGRAKCEFDQKRVELKRRAVENANQIEGYDHE